MTAIISTTSLHCDLSQVNVVMIDNVDSFTYNLVDELRTLGVTMTIYRNTVSADVIIDALNRAPDNSLLLLSPGPGTPSDAGCMLDVITRCKGRFPILGICLGHQAIVQVCGGDVVRADTVVHGKSSAMTHCADKMFSNMPQPMSIARYHSLAVGNLPQELDILGRVDDIPMAVYHKTANMLGLQFHPESILTYRGSQLLRDCIAFLINHKQP